MITMIMIMIIIIIIIINKNSSFRRSTALLRIRKYSAWSYIFSKIQLVVYYQFCALIV